jgi:hypothetical protein
MPEIAQLLGRELEIQQRALVDIHVGRKLAHRSTRAQAAASRAFEALPRQDAGTR